MKAFVTGATGFIGRRLVARLVDDGWQVVALVRRRNPGLPEPVAIVRGDLLAPATLGEAGDGCDRLFHLAALVTFDPRRRGELLRVNGTGTANILAAARRWGVERTVVASSAITLGLSPAREQILDEGATADPAQAARNPYLASKLEAERVALARSAPPAVVVNPTTVYGPGDASLNSGTLILKVARSPVLPVPAGGSNVVDVDDVVAGILAAGERGEAGRRYVLGGENLRFSEIFATVAEVVGHRPRLVPVPGWARPLLAAAAGTLGRMTKNRFLTSGLVDELFAFKFYACDRARTELGWRPRHAFAASVERAWDYYRQAGLVGDAGEDTGAAR